MKTRLLLCLVVFITTLGAGAAHSTPIVAPLSNDAGLKTITLSTGSQLTLISGPANVNYSASVTAGTSSLTITPTTRDANATVTVNGVPVLSGNASQTINIPSNPTVINIQVTAQDGVTHRSFAITVYKNGSSNPGLKSLVLSSGSSITRVSGSSDVNYSASVTAGTSSITIMPTATDANATMTVNGVAVVSGAASQVINLTTNPTNINLIITAQDGVTQRTYSLAVYKNGSSNAGLSLTLSTGSQLTTVTGSSNVNYSASVAAATASLTVTPTLKDPNATVTVNGVAATSGSPSQAISISTNPTVINLLVTAQDGTQRSYSVTVYKNGSSDANMSFTLSTGSTLTRISGSSDVNYSASVTPATTSLTVTPTTQDANAIVTVNGVAVTSGSPSQAINISTNPTVINLLVTAQDGVTKRSYSVTVYKNGSSDVKLKSIVLSTLSQLTRLTTGPANINYSTSVTPGTASLTLIPTADDPNAVVTVNGVVVASGSSSQVINLPTDPTVINLLVTGQDGTTTRSYSISVAKNGSSNASLKSIILSTGSQLTQVAGPSNINYTASVTPGTTSLKITPTTADAGATVTVNGVAVTSGTASQTIALNAGPTTINLLVTAQDGTTTRSYSITVLKNGSSNAALKSLKLSTGSPLTQVAGPDNINYSATVVATTTSLTVIPTASDVNATITVNGNPVASGSASQIINLNAGSTFISVLVTAQDGTTQRSYSITVNRPVSVTTLTWTGAGSDANWSNNNNWSPSSKHPIAGDTVIIGSNAKTPIVDVSSACAVINITGSTTLTMNAPLIVSDVITLNAGLTVNGATGNITSKNLTIKAGFALTNLSAVTITNGLVGFGAAASINNTSDATFTLNGGTTVDFAAGTATGGFISNAGTFYAGTMNSACTINLNYQNASVQNTGTFYLGSSSVVNLTGAGSNLKNSGTFTLQSDSTGSATIGAIAATSSGCVGTYSVERYISGGSAIYRSYRLLSSPVYQSSASGNHIYSLNYITQSSLTTGTGGIPGGFDRAGNPSLYLYRDNIAASNISFTSGNFRGISDISAAPSYSIDVDGSGFNIPVANGYMFFFRGDRTTNLANKFSPGTVAESVTMTATGTLNTGQITVKQWFTPTSSNLDYTPVTGNENVVGFALTGNPYASSIDWDTYNQASSTTGIYAPHVGPFSYILDPVSKNYSVYSAGFGGVGTIATTDANIIPSGQGFFVQASDASGQLIFNESAKTNTQVSKTNHNLFLGRPETVMAPVRQYINLKLTKDGKNTDGIFINFNNTAKDTYSFSEDAPYRRGNGTVSLSSTSADGVALAVNTLALPKQNRTIIGLNVDAEADGNYQLNLASLKSVPEIYDVWLMDAYKKDSVDMRHNLTYAFDIAKGDAASFGAQRFSLVIRQNAALGMRLLDFTASKANSGAQVNWKTINEQNYTNFTVERSIDNGKTFEVMGGFASTAQGAYGLLDKNPASEDQYRLKLVDLNGTISYSGIVTLMYSKSGNDLTKSAINIYPNPTRGNINLAINQTALNAPMYSIQIVSNSGVVVKTATSSQSNWQTDVSKLLPGTYVIHVLNNSTKSVVGKGTFVKL